jgi:hypothetical protein
MEKTIKIKDEEDKTLYEVKLTPDESFKWTHFFRRLVFILLGGTASIFIGKFLAEVF